MPSKRFEISLKRIEENEILGGKERADELRQKGETLSVTNRPTEPYQLPLWETEKRALPHPMTRSALFTPVARGKRKVSRNLELIASRPDTKILFSGEQLDIGDQDVFYQVIELAKQKGMGEFIRFNRAEFLRAIGRAAGKATYEWLHRSLDRLNFAQIKVETKRCLCAFHLIDKIIWETQTDDFILKVDNDVRSLFDEHQYGLIDWQKRKQIHGGKKDLAKFIQSYANSHKRGEEHKIKLHDLMVLAGRSLDSRLDMFRADVKIALVELKRLEIISETGRVTENDIVCFIPI